MPEGKIIKALSGFYYVLDESEDSDKVIQCRGRGIFRKTKLPLLSVITLCIKLKMTKKDI